MQWLLTVHAAVQMAMEWLFQSDGGLGGGPCGPGTLIPIAKASGALAEASLPAQVSVIRLSLSLICLRYAMVDCFQSIYHRSWSVNS